MKEIKALLVLSVISMLVGLLLGGVLLLTFGEPFERAQRLYIQQQDAQRAPPK